MHRQAATFVASCEKGGKGCFGVDAGVAEAAACSNGSVPVIETLEVVRKSRADIIWSVRNLRSSSYFWGLNCCQGFEVFQEV